MRQSMLIKGSMDAVKQRISEVLLAVKESLKAKSDATINDLKQ